MVIRGYDVVELAKKTWSEIGKDKISVYAAQMAYSMFFALFPLLLFFAALLSLVADRRAVVDEWTRRIAAAMPTDVAGLLTRTIERVLFANGAPGLLSFGLLVAAWSGSGIFAALRVALNAAYEVEETRPWWKQYAVQLGMLVLAGAVIVLSTVILLNGEGVVGWLGTRLGLEAVTTRVWTVLQFPLALCAVVAVLFMIYYFLPNCGHRSKQILIAGSIVATALWIAATLLFRLYVQRFNTLNPAYGAVGAIMVLLTWMYYSSFVLLAVGELTAELQKGTGRVDRLPAENIGRDLAPLHREIRALLTTVGTGTFLCAIGVTLGFLGALALITGLILVIGDQWLPHDWYMLGALVVAVVAGVLSWIVGRRGASSLSGGVRRAHGR
jgi:membrane protein